MGLPINQDYQLYNLLFADDQVIIAQHIEDTEKTGRRIHEMGLQINFGKTEYLTLDLGGRNRD
jgi:hypothetical protein